VVKYSVWDTCTTDTESASEMLRFINVVKTMHNVQNTETYSSRHVSSEADRTISATSLRMQLERCYYSKNSYQ
jgi:hypothetical protein